MRTLVALVRTDWLAGTVFGTLRTARQSGARGAADRCIDMGGTIKLNPKVDAFILSESGWQKEFAELRRVILDCGLKEELKWGCPCYTVDDANIVVMHGFKEYCAILFFKGSLMKDPEGILIQQTKNVQAARQLRFTNRVEIVENRPVIRAYLREAIRVERAGLKVKLKETSEFPVPVEFQRKLDSMPALKTAFSALTPGRQRSYIFYFSTAKQSKTREFRIEKHIQRILDGKGLND